MNWTKNHSYNPDRDIIKTRLDFEFIETEKDYILVLNEEDHSVYPKENYSDIRAQLEAAETVNQAIEKHGKNSVYYSGFFSNHRA